MRKAGNRIELVAPTGVIQTFMYEDPKSHAETLKEMDAFFKEIGLLKAD